MRLNDPNRPFAAPGVKALLLDGGAVPNLTCAPFSDTMTRIIVGLHNYDCGAAFSYSYEAIKLPNEEIPALLSSYFLDPEATLKAYWNWEPRAPNKRVNVTRTTPKLPPSPDVVALINLL